MYLFLAFLMLFQDQSVLERPTFVSDSETAPVLKSDVDEEIVRAMKVALTEELNKERAKPFKRLFQRFDPSVHKDIQKIRKLERILRNPAAIEQAAVKFGPEIEMSVTAEGDGRFLEIIQWIIENQDEIIRFIMAIIDLFSQHNLYLREFVVVFQDFELRVVA